LDPPNLVGARASYEQAAASYAQAAAAGNAHALLNLGSLLAYKLDPPNLVGARAAYEQAVAAGVPGARGMAELFFAAHRTSPVLSTARANWAQRHPRAALVIFVLLLGAVAQGFAGASQGTPQEKHCTDIADQTPKDSVYSWQDNYDTCMLWETIVARELVPF